MKRARVQIDHEGPQRRAVRIETGHLAPIGFAQPVKSVDHIDVEIEKRISAGITIQRIFDQTFGSGDIDSERLGEFPGLNAFFHARQPAKIRRLQRGLPQGFRRTRRPLDKGGDHALVELPGVGAVGDEVKERARIQIVRQVEKVELLPHHSDHPGQCGPDGVGPRYAPFLVKLIQ